MIAYANTVKLTVGRNDKCPCGSDKKYKACCLRKDEELALANRYAPSSEQCDDFNNYISSRAYHAHHYKVPKHLFPIDLLVQTRVEKLRAELAYEKTLDGEIDEYDSVEFVMSIKSNDGKPITEGVKRAIDKYEKAGQIRDAMNGLKAGDDKEIRIRFPHDHKSKLLKGRDLKVRIKIIEAKCWVEVSHGYLAEQHGYDNYQEMLDDIEFDLKAALEIEETLLTGSQLIAQIISSSKGEVLNDENVFKLCRGLMRQELGGDFEEFAKLNDAEFKKSVNSLMEWSLVPLIAKAEGIQLSSTGQKDNIRKYELFLDVIGDDAGDEKETRETMKDLMQRYMLYKHLVETLDIEYLESDMVYH